jgi:hypothetical protein
VLSDAGPDVAGASRAMHNNVFLDPSGLSPEVAGGPSPDVPSLFQGVAPGVPATPCPSSSCRVADDPRESCFSSDRRLLAHRAGTR